MSASVKLTGRYVKQSRDLHTIGQQQADGNYLAAIKTLQEAIGHLRCPLHTAGVVVPQAPEN